MNNISKLIPTTKESNTIITDFTKQYDFEHKKDRLYIHWDILSKCNFDCSYCYAKRYYTPNNEWGLIDSYINQELVLKALNLAELPIFLGLLGGEPTIHPRFLDLYEKTVKLIQKHPDSRLYITTNGSTSIFSKIPYYDNVFFLFSIHIEFKHLYGKNYEKVINNIKLMSSRGFKTRVNFLLLPEKKYWGEIWNIYNQLKQIPNISIHPHFLYNDPCELTSLFDYNPEFYEEFKIFAEEPGYFVYESDSEHIKLNDYQIFKNHLNQFKGFKCYNNNYEISWCGDVVNICKKQKVNIKDNLFFFKNIKKIDYMICPYKECNCDGLLKIYKERV